MQNLNLKRWFEFENMKLYLALMRSFHSTEKKVIEFEYLHK